MNHIRRILIPLNSSTLHLILHLTFQMIIQLMSLILINHILIQLEPHWKIMVIPQKLDQSCEPLIDVNKCIPSWLIHLFKILILNMILIPSLNLTLRTWFMIHDTPMIPHPHDSHVHCPFSDIDQVDTEHACEPNQILLYTINPHLILHM